ncbi:hypothetical protein ASF45_25095 [Pseudorhodoferax sp. Leaf265]|nr:hypothetical protein ASF45_25095 [Pseudorhodoferax sp. Leaf265]
MAVQDIANWAIRTVPERVKAQGKHVPSRHGAPEHWVLQFDGINVLVASGCQRRPTDPSLSNMMTVWPERGRKFFDLAWMPDELDDPPEALIRLTPALETFMTEFGGAMEYQRLLAVTLWPD